MSRDDVDLINIKGFTITNFSNNVVNFDIETVIRNDGAASVKLQDAKLTLWFDERAMGTITQTAPVKLKSHKQDTYVWPVAVKLNKDPSNLMALARQFMNDKQKMRLTGTVKAKAMFVSKTINIDHRLN